MKAKKLDGRGWHRGGADVSYYQNETPKRRKEEPASTEGVSAPPRKRYTLAFRYSFEHPGDTVFFAYCYPYTYTRLQMELNELEAGCPYGVMQRGVLCASIAGNAIERITIPAPNIPYAEKASLETRQPSKKRVVVVSGRVHPGETVTSFIVMGLLRFLVSDDLV